MDPDEGGSVGTFRDFLVFKNSVTCTVMGIQASMIYRPVVTDAHIANALRIAQTKQNNTGDQVKYQSKAVRLVEYKVRQKQQMVEAKDIEDILDSMYPRGTWRL